MVLQYANTVSSLADTDSGQNATAGITVGVQVLVTGDGYLGTVRWYCGNLSREQPSHAAVYDTDDTTTPIWGWHALSTATAIGWQETVVTEPVSLLDGHTYRVAFSWPGTYHSGLAYTNSPTRPTGSSHIALSGATYWTYNSDGGAQDYPNLLREVNQNIGVDMGWSDTVGGSSGGAIGDFAAWLSTDSSTNAHKEDGTPWQTWQDNLALVSRIPQVSTTDQTTYGLSSRDLTTAVVKALAFLVANADKIDIVKGWFSGVRNPSTQDAIDTILNRIDLQTGNGQLESQWASGQVLGTAHHTLVDSFPFTGQVGWGSGYALHRIHIDTSDAQHPMIDIGAGGFWVPGFGWWAATLPDGSLTERQRVEFSDQWLWPVPAAATGLILWCHPSSSGTLYAYSTD